MGGGEIFGLVMVLGVLAIVLRCRQTPALDDQRTPWGMAELPPEIDKLRAD